ncbi:MAG: hypothetical protein VZQ29_08790, partial [Succiniclasticum sp.]|nr:hypothetical protein [Succiniclasticum sp.]
MSSSRIVKEDSRNREVISFSNFTQTVHEKALRLYHDYLYIGGMPEMVKNYIENEKNIQRLDASLYQNLKFAYLADMSKHVTSPAE